MRIELDAIMDSRERCDTLFLASDSPSPPRESMQDFTFDSPSREEVVVKVETVKLGPEFEYPEREIVLTSSKPSLPIGRASKVASKGCLAGEDNGWFASPVMSRVHASLTADFRDKRVHLEDLGSLHGTWLARKDCPNENKLFKNERLSIEDGDHLRFGSEIHRGTTSFPPCRVQVGLQWRLEGHGASALPKPPTVEMENVPYSVPRPADATGPVDVGDVTTCTVRQARKILPDDSFVASDESSEVGSENVAITDVASNCSDEEDALGHEGIFSSDDSEVGDSDYPDDPDDEYTEKECAMFEKNDADPSHPFYAYDVPDVDDDEDDGDDDDDESVIADKYLDLSDISPSADYSDDDEMQELILVDPECCSEEGETASGETSSEQVGPQKQKESDDNELEAGSIEGLHNAESHPAFSATKPMTGSQRITITDLLCCEPKEPTPVPPGTGNTVSVTTPLNATSACPKDSSKRSYAEMLADSPLDTSLGPATSSLLSQRSVLTSHTLQRFAEAARMHAQLQAQNAFQQTQPHLRFEHISHGRHMNMKKRMGRMREQEKCKRDRRLLQKAVMEQLPLWTEERLGSPQDNDSLKVGQDLSPSKPMCLREDASTSTIISASDNSGSLPDLKAISEESQSLNAQVPVSAPVESTRVEALPENYDFLFAPDEAASLSTIIASRAPAVEERPAKKRRFENVTYGVKAGFLGAALGGFALFAGLAATAPLYEEMASAVGSL